LGNFYSVGQEPSVGQSHTPEPKLNGYPEEVRVQAVRLYLEGTNFRRIGRLLSVNHQSAVNWVNAYHHSLPAAKRLVTKPQTIELDEMFTFVGTKKKPVYIVAAVDRATRCIVGWTVVWERTTAALQ
jgi:transposase-like protein